jgi:hypothetical protein
MKRLLSILCILALTVTIFGINEQSAYAEEVISAESVSLDNSSILELKNNRGNNFNIDSVRIWLGQDDSFKSFKTENGWMGKFEVGGKVLAFSPQDSVKPGESVKFGLKTINENPVINWKALDSNGQTIQTAVVLTKQSDKDETSRINQPKIIAINDNSVFRFIPERPSIGSDFRIIGENFIPNQNIEFYIGDQMAKLIKIDGDGKFISTATIPSDNTSDRTEFILIDSGGTEKKISLRLLNTENREISQDVKILIEHTNASVKRGEEVKLQGDATPDTTLTLTTKNKLGKILDINTITTGFDGKWEFNKIFPNDLNLGKILIEVTDGKSTVVRTFDVISSQLINIESVQKRYEIGDEVKFVGTAIPNTQLSVIIEDPVGVEIFSKTIDVDSSGNVDFDVGIGDGYTEGTYVLFAFQGAEEAISVVGIGMQPESVMIVNTSKLNYNAGSVVDLNIQGEPHSSVAIVVIDGSDQTKINDSIDLDVNGNFVYEIDSTEIGTGAFTVEVRHGVSRDDTVFTVGLSTGSGSIEFQTIKSEYTPGEQILVIGKTANSVILTVKIDDPNGMLFREFDIFSDRIGTFKIDDFRIPSNGLLGQWSINIGSEGNFTEEVFTVESKSDMIQIKIDRENGTYNTKDMMAMNGKNAVSGSTVVIAVNDPFGTQVTELRISITDSGEYYTLWQIPQDLEVGTYEILVTDGFTNDSISFTIN